MKFGSVIDILTFILIIALFALVIKKSSQFTSFVQYGSSVFNKSIGALGGQNVG